MRFKAKVDGNHEEIVQALRKAGCQVLSLAAVGHGCPDLLCLRSLRLYLLEIKDGSLSPSRRKLTPDQEVFHSLWPVKIVTSIEEALAATGCIEP